MNKGQTIVEYVIIIGIVIVAIYAMGPAIKRSMQTVVKASADQLGVQNRADQDFTPDGSHMASSSTAIRAHNEKNVTELAGQTETASTESTVVSTNTVTALGFQQ